VLPSSFSLEKHFKKMHLETTNPDFQKLKIKFDFPWRTPLHPLCHQALIESNSRVDLVQPEKLQDGLIGSASYY
jgi:hypothetical protein